MTHDIIMENWLAGKDLAYDHHNTGALGQCLYFEFRNTASEPVIGDYSRTLNRVRSLFDGMQYADILVVVDGAGFELRVP